MRIKGWYPCSSQKSAMEASTKSRGERLPHLPCAKHEEKNLDWLEDGGSL